MRPWTSWSASLITSGESRAPPLSGAKCSLCELYTALGVRTTPRWPPSVQNAATGKRPAQCKLRHSAATTKWAPMGVFNAIEKPPKKWRQRRLRPQCSGHNRPQARPQHGKHGTGQYFGSSISQIHTSGGSRPAVRDYKSPQRLFSFRISEIIKEGHRRKKPTQRSDLCDPKKTEPSAETQLHYAA